jgi:hypothetical protein
LLELNSEQAKEIRERIKKFRANETERQKETEKQKETIKQEENTNNSNKEENNA